MKTYLKQQTRPATELELLALAAKFNVLDRTQPGSIRHDLALALVRAGKNSLKRGVKVKVAA